MEDAKASKMNTSVAVRKAGKEQIVTSQWISVVWLVVFARTQPSFKTPKQGEIEFF